MASFFFLKKIFRLRRTQVASFEQSESGSPRGGKMQGEALHTKCAKTSKVSFETMLSNF